MTQQYLRGMEELRRIDPTGADASIQELTRLCPDAAEYFVGFGFAEIYARNNFDPKTKALISIASLIGFGRCDGFFRTHVLGALRAGCSRADILEVALLNSALTGFPNMLLAIKYIGEAFAAADAESDPPTPPASP